VIVCRKCSRRHPDGTDFCACGAFLEFDGERIVDPAPAAPANPAEPAAAATAGAPPAPDAGAAARQTPTRDGPAAPADPAPWSGLPGSGNWADPATPAAPADTTSVSARLPDAPEAPRVTEPVVVAPTGRAGDAACPGCGTANAPERQFCQHCGLPLAGGGAATGAAAVTTGAAKPSWWRRAFGRVRGKAETTDPRRLSGMAHGLQSGRVPGLSGRAMAFRTGGIAVILVGLLAFLGPWRGTVLRFSRDRVGASRYTVVDVDPANYTAVATDPATAPVVFPLQDVDRLVDGYANTAWATHWLDVTDPGLEAAPEAGATCPSPARTDSYLHLEFAEPTDLARIRILGGRPAADETRTAYLRPLLVELRVNEADTCTYLTLTDDGELETHDFERDDVEQIELRVLGVYADAESESPVEISEIVLERRR
jgi:hypothetical protein